MKKGLLWGCGGLAGLVVLIIVISALASGSKPSNSTANNSPSSSPAVAQAGSSRSNPVPVGHTANVSGWTVKVVSVTPETSDISGPIPAGTNFDVYNLQVTNTTSTPAAPSTTLLVDLVGANSVSYSVDSNPLCYGGTPDNDNVYQGGTVSFGGCISLPSNVTGLELNVSTISSTNPVWFAIPS